MGDIDALDTIANKNKPRGKIKSRWKWKQKQIWNESEVGSYFFKQVAEREIGFFRNERNQSFNWDFWLNYEHNHTLYFEHLP